MPCLIGGSDSETWGTDECYPGIGSDVNDQTGLLAAIPGCIVTDLAADISFETAAYYCSCDLDNGWTINTVDNDGTCVRVAFQGGQQDDGLTPPVAYDECWPKDTVATGFIDPSPEDVESIQDYPGYTGTQGSFFGCIFEEAVATDTATTPHSVTANSGYAKCDEANGYYQYFTDPGAKTTPLASTVDAPCMYAAYMPGQQGSDECWALTATVGDILLVDDTALKAAVPGCILNPDTDPRGTPAGTGFAVCDETNGWYMPTTCSGTPLVCSIDLAWNGKCIPACYKFGYQGVKDTAYATGALLVTNLEDECWHTTTDIAAADYNGTPFLDDDDFLSNR